MTTFLYFYTLVNAYILGYHWQTIMAYKPFQATQKAFRAFVVLGLGLFLALPLWAYFQLERLYRKH